MARSKYRKEIEDLIEYLNNKTGMNYMTDYAPHYGGWNLYRLNEHSGHCSGMYGFDYRLSNKENGCLSAWFIDWITKSTEESLKIKTKRG